MALDDGMISKIEAYFVAQLRALEYDDNKVFRDANDSVDHWKFQLAGGKGGLEAFERFAPFAFVSYMETDSAREGGKDLRQIPTIDVLIGVSNKYPGVARLGDATTLGCSKIRDLVIALFENVQPTDIACDEIRYISDIITVETEKLFAMQLKFELSFM